MMSKIVIIIVNFLLLFLTSTETKLSKKSKSTATTTVSSDNKMLVRECFADFLVGGQFDLPEMSEQFALNPMWVDREQLRTFLLENEEKTAQLWHCVNNAIAFTKIAEESEKSKQTGGEHKRERRTVYAQLVNLMDTFRMEIAKLDTIAPSQRVQGKLHNAQCLLDLGVIEGKILMKKQKNSEWSNENAEWSQQLRAGEPIVISKEGGAHLKMCLRKGKPFDVKMAKGPAQHVLSLDSVEREELVKIISKPLVAYSNWLRKKISLNLAHCLANFFVLHFGAQIDMNERQFVVRNDYFPGQDSVTGLNEREMQPFVDCMTSVSSPFKKFFSNRQQMGYFVQDFYESNTEMIAVSYVIQQKFHNAQCWLDLGAMEGKIMGNTRIIEIHRHFWLKELASDQPVIISAEGAAHLQSCLHKRKPFEAKLEENTTANQWHLQLLNTSERGELFATMKIVPFSQWLQFEYGLELTCLSDFLVRQQFAQTILVPGTGLRMIVWENNDDELKWPAKVHAKDTHPDNFWKLRSCILRKSSLLKMDTASKQQYIDFKAAFKLAGGRIYVSHLLKQQLDIQSDCLAKFVAIKHCDGGKCLLKKRRAPSGYFIFEINDKDPFRPYIVNFGDSARVYALSAENCHLPEGDTGVYSEGSEEFEQLKECVVQMMNTTEDVGKKAINVRSLLKMHVPEQLYLRGFPVEIFPTIVPTPGDENLCVICQEEYGQGNDRIVVLPCKHEYHSNCLQEWIREQDRCPICKAEILKNIPVDPTELFSSDD